MGVIKSVKDLEVYVLAYKIAMDIFQETKNFPSEERYSLIDQIRRSSRSMAVNISEGWGKRTYEQMFKRHLIDSMGSVEETKTWLDFSKDCEYLSFSIHQKLIDRLEELGAKNYRLHENWKSR